MTQEVPLRESRANLMGRALCEELYVLALIASGRRLFHQLREDFGTGRVRASIFSDPMLGPRALRRALLARTSEPEHRIHLVSEDHRHERQLRTALAWIERLWQPGEVTRPLHVLPMNDDARRTSPGASGLYVNLLDHKALSDRTVEYHEYRDWLYGASGHAEIYIEGPGRSALRIFVHELAHHWESHSPEIELACDVFSRLRLRRWELEHGYSISGGDYGNWHDTGGYNLVRGEVFSTGIEAILCGSYGQLRGLVAPWIPRHLRPSDPAQLRLVLGLVAMGGAVQVGKPRS